MYGNQPNNWHDAKSEEEKFRYTINAFTRMRYCHTDSSLEFTCKEAPTKAHKTLLPWFELVNLNQQRWIFGHWATLMGQCSNDNIYALDTGCVWGNHLTMLRWHDKKLFTEPAHPHHHLKNEER
jgi:bis(5'-nucleosyl)-tetraphosphatase (symmetrical)